MNIQEDRKLKPRYLVCIWCGSDKPKDKPLAKYCSQKCDDEVNRPLPKDYKMRWTSVNLITHERKSIIKTMAEVEKLREENPQMVYEVQNYPFLTKENHPLRWFKK